MDICFPNKVLVSAIPTSYSSVTTNFLYSYFATLSVTPISYYCLLTTQYLPRLLLTDNYFSYSYQLNLPTTISCSYQLLLLTNHFSYCFQVLLSGNIITYSYQLLKSTISFRYFYQLLVSTLLVHSCKVLLSELLCNLSLSVRVSHNL